MKVYLNQSNLTLSLITNNDLVSVASSVIKYRKPNTIEGQWTATINGQLVEYAVQNNDLDMVGDWSIWVHIVFNNGKISIGEASILTINEPGT